MASAPSLSPNSAMLAALASEPKNMQPPYPCKKGLDSDECQAAFIQNKKFKYIYVDADGNCLFRALSEFYKLTDMPVQGFRDQKYWTLLRPFLIDKVEKMMENYSNTLETMIVTNFINQTERRKEQLLSRMAVYQDQLEQYPKAQKKYKQELATYLMMKDEGIHMNEPKKPESPKSPEKLPSIKKKTVDQLFSELRGEGAWDVAMIELLISRLPAILGVNISIHKVEHDSTRSNSYKVTNYFYRPVGDNPEHTINLMLNGAHYGLLVPLPKNAVFNNEKDENSSASGRARPSAASRKARPSVSGRVRPSVSRKSQKASSNNQNAELQAALEQSRAMAASHVNNNIDNIERQFAELESGALESGMKPSRRNQIAALKQQISQLELKQSVKNPVNNMSAAFANVSLRNRNNSFDCDNATVAKLKEHLISRGYNKSLSGKLKPYLVELCKEMQSRK